MIDYHYLLKAQMLKENDKERDKYHLAWLVHVAGSTKKQGKDTVMKYQHFEDFYNHERIENIILDRKDEKEERKDKVSRLMMKINERRYKHDE